MQEQHIKDHDTTLVVSFFSLHVQWYVYYWSFSLAALAAILYVSQSDRTFASAIFLGVLAIGTLISLCWAIVFNTNIGRLLNLEENNKTGKAYIEVAKKANVCMGISLIVLLVGEILICGSFLYTLYG